MSIKLLSTLVVINLMICSSLQAQHNSTIQDFTLSDIHNKDYSLSDFQNHQAVVVIFSNNYCPYAKLYDERIIELTNKYQSRKVAFLMINPSENLAQMSEAAEKKGYTFPYLSDTNQEVSRMFGATKAPEAFLLIRRGPHFQVSYQGAIDDNPQVADDVRESYLQDAIESALNSSRPMPSSQRPVGCMIK